MIHRSLIQVLTILLLSIFPVVGQIGIARSADVTQPTDIDQAIQDINRLIVLEKEGAISSIHVMDRMSRLAQDNDNPRFTAFLMQLLNNTNQDAFIRRGAAKGLGSMHQSARSVIPELVRRLQDPDLNIRGGAAAGLGAMGERAKSTIPQLIPLLKDPHPFVFCSTTQTLGSMGEPAKIALRPLIRRLNDKTPAVRDCAAFALEEIEPFLGPEKSLSTTP
jgi:HEAT repeat protein